MISHSNFQTFPYLSHSLWLCNLEKCREICLMENFWKNWKKFHFFIQHASLPCFPWPRSPLWWLEEGGASSRVSGLASSAHISSTYRLPSTTSSPSGTPFHKVANLIHCHIRFVLQRICEFHLSYSGIGAMNVVVRLLLCGCYGIVRSGFSQWRLSRSWHSLWLVKLVWDRLYLPNWQSSNA